MKGFISEEELTSFTVGGSRLIGYPYAPEIGLEYSGGSLGMALSVGVGQAIAGKKRKRDYKVYVLMGDGELNEGSVWESLMAASHFALDNLVAVIDRNHLCYDGTTEDIMSLGQLSDKFAAFGWNPIVCDGHDIGALLRAFGGIRIGAPPAVICETVKGKGLTFAENRPEWHQKAITQAQYDEALAELMEGRVL